MNETFLQLANLVISIIGVFLSATGIFGVFIYVGRKLEKLDRLDRTVEILKDNVKVIADHLANNDSGFDISYLKTYSPVQLTDDGHTFLDELGFPQVFEEHKEDFYKFIEFDGKPKLKYDVEKEAIKSIWVLSDKDFMKFLKVHLYNNPEHKMKDTAPTLGVYVRDAYLADHPEITE